MFDSLPPVPRNAALHAVRRFLSDHGHELAEAARLLGGVAAEARVISHGIHLENATRIDSRIRRDLVAFHRLLGLHDVGDPDCLETELFSAISPASRQVEAICLLTDLIEDLLHIIDDDPAASRAAAGDGEDAIAA